MHATKLPMLIHHGFQTDVPRPRNGHDLLFTLPQKFCHKSSGFLDTCPSHALIKDTTKIR